MKPIGIWNLKIGILLLHKIFIISYNILRSFYVIC